MKLAVVGLGLIGASVAKALAGRASITGIDRDPGAVKKALDQGVISRGGSDPSLARGSEIVVIAVPVGRIVGAAGDLIPHLDANAVITDTGSTKEAIVRAIDGLWPCFVGSHPIAGKENPGFGASQPDLFSGKVTILTPGAATRNPCLQRVRSLWEACGSKVVEMDPVQHDGLMARISHMPHLLSFASMGLAHDLHIHRELLGAGFRDFTRIAASDPVMWRDIFLANREQLLELVESYIRELEAMAAVIRQGRSEELEELLRGYSSLRRELYASAR